MADVADLEQRFRILYYAIGVLAILYGAVIPLVYVALRSKLAEIFVTKAEFREWVEQHDRWGAQVMEKFEVQIADNRQASDRVVQELGVIRVMLFDAIQGKRP